MSHKYILSLDLGTTGNRALVFDRDGNIKANAYYEFPQRFPKPAWIEHDPMDIWNTTLKAMREVVDQVGVETIETIGITNQRETVVIWEKSTGKPVHNAIVWQCRRTSDYCKANKDMKSTIKDKTGLFLDPYFSGTKIVWLLDNVPGLRARANNGEVVFGTIDTWILFNLTGGAHLTEASNASRTLLYNIHKADYDAELLNFFKIPTQLLPEVKDSCGEFGKTRKSLLGREIPITGILGDQQAALFAQGGWEKGVLKNTYGTGLFLITSTGDQVLPSGKIINTIAWKMDGKIEYALEGSIFIGGSAVQWLRDGLKMIKSAEETEDLARSLSGNEDVYFVPALAGLGAPYWDPTARGVFCGLTRGTTIPHMVRATLESMAYQSRDVIEEMSKVINDFKIDRLRVDGGAIKNNFLMQFQADILGMDVERPVISETTAFGAAGIAGLATGFWSKEEFLKVRKVDKVFRPSMDTVSREKLYQKWGLAVEKSLGWA